MHSFNCWSAFVAFLLLLTPAHAQTGILTRVGPVYEIGEESFEQQFKRAAQAMKDKGEMERAQEKIRKLIWKAFNDPDPIPGIKPAEERNVRYVDPGIVLDHDIVWNDKVIAKSGTYVNALDKLKLDHGFLFLDSRDPRQKVIGKQILDHYGARHVRVILIGGGPQPLGKEWKTDVYYDQGGFLTRKLAIKSTPIYVTQDEKNRRLLRVDEIPVN